jgi:hypothetical protein
MITQLIIIGADYLKNYFSLPWLFGNFGRHLADEEKGPCTTVYQRGGFLGIVGIYVY